MVMAGGKRFFGGAGAGAGAVAVRVGVIDESIFICCIQLLLRCSEAEALLLLVHEE